MKPWFERTLLVVAIVLAVFAASWSAMNWMGTRDLEQLRERWEANGGDVDLADCLSPMDHASNAGARSLDALNRLVVWWLFTDATRGEIEKAEKLADQSAFRPETWRAEQAALFAVYDDPAYQEPLSEFISTVVRPECCLFRIYEGSRYPYVPGGLTIHAPEILEREACRQFLMGNRARACDIVVSTFALAAHLREAPTVNFCHESDMCLLSAVDMLRFCAERGALDAPLALRIQAWLAHIQPEADWIRALDGERVLFAEYAWAGLREGAPPMGVTYPSGSGSGLLYSKLARPWRLMEERKYFEVLEQKYALMLEHPWEKVRRPDIPVSFQLARMLTTSQDLDGESRLRIRRARDLADIASRLVLLHAETGTCPDSLASLRDLPCEPPLCQPYSFARTETGFTLGLSDPANDPNGAHTWRVEWSPPR